MNPRLTYRTAAVRGASPVGLVILLYEQAIEDLRHALAALTKGDVEVRTRHLDHALLVIGQLEASLDMDRGGEVARNLERFYTIVRGCLVNAQIRESAAGLEEQIAHLIMLREAWVEVETFSGGSKVPVGETAQPFGKADKPTTAEWSV